MEKTLTNRSRCGKLGSFLRCPFCGRAGLVQHFYWAAKSCTFCPALPAKRQWALVRHATMRDTWLGFALLEDEAKDRLRAWLVYEGRTADAANVEVLWRYMRLHGLAPRDEDGYHYLYWPDDLFRFDEVFVAVEQDRLDAEVRREQELKLVDPTLEVL